MRCVGCGVVWTDGRGDGRRRERRRRSEASSRGEAKIDSFAVADPRPATTMGWRALQGLYVVHPRMRVEWSVWPTAMCQPSFTRTPPTIIDFTRASKQRNVIPTWIPTLPRTRVFLKTKKTTEPIKNPRPLICIQKSALKTQRYQRFSRY